MSYAALSRNHYVGIWIGSGLFSFTASFEEEIVIVDAKVIEEVEIAEEAEAV